MVQLVFTEKPRSPLRKIVGVASAAVFVALLIAASVSGVDRIQSSLIGAAPDAQDARCPQGMVAVSSGSGTFCIDTHEASPGSGCIYQDPKSGTETQVNLDQEGCTPVSQEGRMPWRFVSQHEATLACAKAGKHLVTNKEWYAAALGTPEAECGLAVSGNTAVATGTYERCRSSAGAIGMVGNAWEWVEGAILDAAMNGRAFPGAGYVGAVDAEGLPLTTSADAPNASFGSDYFWIEETGAQGIVRGGYWGSGNKGGVYAVYAASPPTFAGDAVGFRCAL